MIYQSQNLAEIFDTGLEAHGDHAATLQTGSIHGNASDGENAVFAAWTTAANASASVLVVNKSGQQRLIPNPVSFGANRLGTIY